MVGGRWDWSSPIGREAAACSSSGAVCVNGLCCVPFGLLCGFTKYSVAGTAPGLTFTMGMLVVDPGDSQAFFHRAASAEPLRQVPGWLQSCTWICYGSCRGSSDSTLPIPPCLRADKAHSCSSQNFPSCRSTCPFRCFTGTKFRKPSAEV